MQFVSVPLLGVPIAGVTKVGEPARTILPVPVTTLPNAAATPVPRPVIPDIGRPVQFVSVPLVGVPNNGVTNVGLVAKTGAPVPV